MEEMRTTRCHILALAVIVAAGCDREPPIDRNRDTRDLRVLQPSLSALLREWRSARSRAELIVDLKDRTLRLGQGGQNVVSLPEGYTWSAYHITPSGHAPLPQVVRLKLRARKGERNACNEFIHIQGVLTRVDGIYIDLRPGGYAPSGTGVALLDSYSVAQ